MKRNIDPECRKLLDCLKSAEDSLSLKELSRLTQIGYMSARKLTRKLINANLVKRVSVRDNAGSILEAFILNTESYRATFGGLSDERKGRQRTRKLRLNIDLRSRETEERSPDPLCTIDGLDEESCHDDDENQEDSSQRIAISYDDSTYLGKELRKNQQRCKRLTEGEERELLRQAATDRTAHYRLLIDNLDGILRAGHDRSGKIDAELAGEAYLGFVDAIKKYEPERSEFRRYAVGHMLHWIATYKANSSRMIRLPEKVHYQLAKMARVEEALQTKLGRAVTIADLVAAMGLKESEIARLKSIQTGTPISLNALIEASSGNEPTNLRSEKNRQPEAIVEAKETYSMILAALLDLNQIERTIVLLKFEFLTGEEMTFEEIGHLLGFSGQYAGRVMKKALRQLKEDPRLKCLSGKLSHGSHSPMWLRRPDSIVARFFCALHMVAIEDGF